MFIKPNDSILSESFDSDDDDLSLMANSQTFDSKYILEKDMNDFFKFDDKMSQNLLHFNMRSVKKMFDKLKCLLVNVLGQVTVIAITEDGLIDATEDAYFLPGYDLVTISRSCKLEVGLEFLFQTHLITHCGMIYVVCQTT